MDFRKHIFLRLVFHLRYAQVDSIMKELANYNQPGFRYLLAGSRHISHAIFRRWYNVLPRGQLTGRHGDSRIQCYSW